jgi:hypothetical protein
MFNWLIPKIQKNNDKEYEDKEYNDNSNNEIIEKKEIIIKTFDENKDINNNNISSDDDTSNESEFYTDFTILMKDGGVVLYEDEKRLLCLVNPKSFLNSVQPFSYNRPINEDHKKLLIEVLEKQYQNNKPIEFYGLFEGFITCSDSIYLANGHHRYYALKEFMNNHKNDTFAMEKLKIELFDFTDLDNNNIEEDERVIELFKSVNTSKEFKYKDLPVFIIHEAIKMINNQYDNCIRNCDNVKKPYISKKNFYDILKSNNVHEKYTSPEKLFKKLVKINEKQSTKLIKDFFEKINTTREKQFKKAQDKKFYLGLLDDDDLIDEIL